MQIRRTLLLPALVVSLLLTHLPVGAANDITFSDTADTIYDTAVISLAEAGIVNGCENDRFCLDRRLTRGQVATMLVNALGLAPVTEVRFVDLAGDHHATAANTLADAGIVAGCGDDQFCSSAPVTRGQLMSMLVRGFDLPPALDGTRYFDDLTEVHAASVRSAAVAGITAGCNDRLTAFCPRDDVSRAHAAMFLARALEFVPRVALSAYEQRAAEQERLDEEARAALPTPGEIAVETALAKLGVPYRWGGSGPDFFDCSGLTSFAWREAGVELPRSSGMQYSATKRISRADLLVGDLVFYHSPISHVAIYIGDGKVVEAPNSGNNVRIRTDGLTRSGVVGYGRPGA